MRPVKSQIAANFGKVESANRVHVRGGNANEGHGEADDDEAYATPCQVLAALRLFWGVP